FFTSRRRHTRSKRDWSSDVCSSDVRRLRLEQAALHWQDLMAPSPVKTRDRAGAHGVDALVPVALLGLRTQDFPGPEGEAADTLQGVVHQAQLPLQLQLVVHVPELATAPAAE